MKEYDLDITLILNEFKVEYAWCWTHQMQITWKIDLDNLQKLFNNIKNIEWIN